MKKTALILALLAASACEVTEPSETVLTPVSINGNIHIYDVDHNGHQWVVFHVKQGYGVAIDAHHSPDCPCLKEADK